MGTAHPSATVSLWAGSGLYSATTRKSNGYYWGELLFSNSAAPVYPIVTNIAVLNNPPGPDPVAMETGRVFVARSPEVFRYDADGNLTNNGRWVFTWDNENRLVKVESLTNAPAGSTRRLEFAYDHQGRRIWKKVTDLDTGATLSQTKFLYDGWNPIAELNATNNNVVRSYVWGLDLSGSMQGAGGVGGLLKVTYYGTQTTNAFVAYDGNGNVLGLVNAADGTLIAHYAYGPFGEVLRATGPMAKANPFRVSTKYQDEETDLIYYGYRYYSASTGRWLSRDPIEEQGGENLYCLAGNDPANKADFLGLDVGTVSVVRSQPAIAPWYMPTLKGWDIELRWHPPAEWDRRRLLCLPCTKVVWVQDWYRHKVSFPFYTVSDVGPKKDWDESDREGSSGLWTGYMLGSGYNFAEMWDKPLIWPTHNVNSYTFIARARAKCIEGPDHGLIYATVYWGFDYSRNPSGEVTGGIFDPDSTSGVFGSLP